MANHFNEEIRHTEFYNGRLKTALKQVQIQLEKSERKEFQRLENSLESKGNNSTMDYIAGNQMDFIKEVVQRPFTEMGVLQNMILAFRKDPKRLEGIMQKILDEK